MIFLNLSSGFTSALNWYFYLLLAYRSEILCTIYSSFRLIRYHLNWGLADPKWIRIGKHNYYFVNPSEGKKCSTYILWRIHIFFYFFQRWAHLSFKSLYGFSLLSDSRFTEWRSDFRKRSKSDQWTDKFSFWAVRSWAIYEKKEWTKLIAYMQYTTALILCTSLRHHIEPASKSAEMVSSQHFRKIRFI